MYSLVYPKPILKEKNSKFRAVKDICGHLLSSIGIVFHHYFTPNSHLIMF